MATMDGDVEHTDIPGMSNEQTARIARCAVVGGDRLQVADRRNGGVRNE